MGSGSRSIMTAGAVENAGNALAHFRAGSSAVTLSDLVPEATKGGHIWLYRANHELRAGLRLPSGELNEPATPACSFGQALFTAESSSQLRRGCRLGSSPLGVRVPRGMAPPPRTGHPPAGYLPSSLLADAQVGSRPLHMRRRCQLAIRLHAPPPPIRSLEDRRAVTHRDDLVVWRQLAQAVKLSRR
jgi:hypothetical protein